MTEPAAVTMTAWRQLSQNELKFLRSIDMWALPLAKFPVGHTLANSVFLEAVVLPAGLRIISEGFFKGCWRLTRVDTAGCTGLEEIRQRSFMKCRALHEFWFPPTVREVNCAFGGIAMTCIDLSETRAERAGFTNMTFLERLILPRRCVLGYALGLPSLQCVTFGLSRAGIAQTWRGPSIRFESMKSGLGRELVSGRVSAEVAAVLSRESSPCSPP
jgi:hypothetical protein